MRGVSSSLSPPGPAHPDFRVILHAVSRLSKLLLVLGFLSLACEGPRGASPLPEPPAIDGSRIGFGNSIAPAAVPADIELVGDGASASPGSTLRVTNLDTTDEPVTTTVTDEGRFSILVSVSPGDELRFEAFRGELRSDPVDLIIDSSGLTPGPRHGCIAFTPGYAVEFDGSTAESLFIDNQCGAPAVVQDPRFRLALPDFALSTPALPVTVAPGRSASLRFGFEPQAAGIREDVFFADIDVDGEVLRYPIGLSSVE